MASGDCSQNKALNDLLEDSKHLSSSVLSEFREIHQLCERSGLFKPDTIMKIDECAVDFRKLGLTTVSIANSTSNVFLEKIIFFHKNLSELKREEIEDHLKTFGKEAKELGDAFNMLAEWSRQVAGNLYKTCQETEHEAKKFVEDFKGETEKAMIVARDAKKKLKEAEARHSSACDTQTNWGIATLATGWTGVGLIVGTIGYLVADAKVSSTASAQEIASSAVSKSAEMFEQAENKEKEAKIIAEKSGTLVGTLTMVETTACAMATFWTIQSNNFLSGGGKMRTSRKDIPEILMRKFLSENLNEWEKIKTGFDSYTDVMSFILNFYNFQTDAQPALTKTFFIEPLDLELKVPSTLSIANN